MQSLTCRQLISRAATVAIVLAMSSLMATAGRAESQKVNAFNFTRAESDLYFSRLAKRNGGLNRLLHQRTPPALDEQAVIRMNRDTLYSSSVHDLAAGPVTASLPGTGDGRFQSLQVVSQDHYTPVVIYEGSVEIGEELVGTRYALIIVRTFADAGNEDDLRRAHAAQDAVSIQQSADGSLEIPSWDRSGLDTARKALASLQALGGAEGRVRMGTVDEVDPVAHLLATATGWGLNPRSEALYFIKHPEGNDGQIVHTLRIGDVPVSGFWSVTVYNKDGYFEKNALDAYSLNNVTAKRSDDGAVVMQFGGCDGQIPNCLPITAGWNYTLRLYRPQQAALDGSWLAPEPQPVMSP